LPQSAVQFGTDGATVLVVKDGTVAVRPVKTGLKGEGLVEIVEGLSEGDTVVARAAGFLREGDKVTPVTDGGAS
jgi:HlyD family secretion protein